MTIIAACVQDISRTLFFTDLVDDDGYLAATKAAAECVNPSYSNEYDIDFEEDENTLTEKALLGYQEEQACGEKKELDRSTEPEEEKEETKTKENKSLVQQQSLVQQIQRTLLFTDVPCGAMEFNSKGQETAAMSRCEHMETMVCFTDLKDVDEPGKPLTGKALERVRNFRSMEENIKSIVDSDTESCSDSDDDALSGAKNKIAAVAAKHSGLDAQELERKYQQDANSKEKKGDSKKKKAFLSFIAALQDNDKRKKRLKKRQAVPVEYSYAQPLLVVPYSAGLDTSESARTTPKTEASTSTNTKQRVRSSSTKKDPIPIAIQEGESRKKKMNRWLSRSLSLSLMRNKSAITMASEDNIPRASSWKMNAPSTGIAPQEPFVICIDGKGDRKSRRSSSTTSKKYVKYP